MPEQQEVGTVTPEPSFREQVEQAEATPAPAEQQQPAEQAQPEQPAQERFVPLGALHEERQKRKNAEAAIRQRDQDMAQLRQQAEERLNYLERLARQNQPAQPEPTFAQDPLTGIYREVQSARAETQDLRRQNAERQQREHTAAVVDHVRQTVWSDEAAFSQHTPDYAHAIDWAKTHKINEYIAVGMPEPEAVARVQNEAAQIAVRAMQEGESPAARGFRLAQAIGYKSQPRGETKLDMQRAGAAASTPSGGGGRGGRPSLDSILKMDSKDFLSATEGDKWRKLVGG